MPSGTTKFPHIATSFVDVGGGIPASEPEPWASVMTCWTFVESWSPVQPVETAMTIPNVIFIFSMRPVHCKPQRMRESPQSERLKRDAVHARACTAACAHHHIDR